MCPLEPSAGCLETRLVPNGGVLRVHGARSFVFPRLPQYATPRHASSKSMSGAYPLRRPLMCGHLGCWRSRARAIGSSPVRSSGLPWMSPDRRAGVRRPCPTVAFADAVPCLCACSARGRGVGPVPFLRPPPPLSSCIPRGFCRGGLFWPGFPCPGSLVAHSMWSRRSRSWSVNPFGSWRVPFVCWCTLLRCPLLFVMRALREVPLQGARRAVPSGLCPSALRARVCALRARYAEGCLCQDTLVLPPC